MDSKHKIRVKVGDLEFEAEGRQEKVESQFKQFIALVQNAPATVAPRRLDSESPAASELGDQEGVSTEILNRAFKVGKDSISLRVLPKSKTRDADTLLLLIYGHAILKKQHDVLAGHVLKGGNQSGLKLKRVDRCLAAHDEFIQKGGSGKGARYGLNNRGLAKARQILAELFK